MVFSMSVTVKKSKLLYLLDRIANEQDFFSRVITGDETWTFNTILRPRGKVRRGTLWALLDQRKLEWANLRSNQYWFVFLTEGESSTQNCSSKDVISGLWKTSKRSWNSFDPKQIFGKMRNWINYFQDMPYCRVIMNSELNLRAPKAM